MQGCRSGPTVEVWDKSGKCQPGANAGHVRFSNADVEKALRVLGREAFDHAPAEIRDLRVFIGHGIANARVPLSLAKEDYRLFYAAGMPVEMHTYPTTQRIHPHMLRDLNRWIIERCNKE